MGTRIKDITGQRFALLVVLCEVPGRRYGKVVHRRFRCLCDCGEETTTTLHALRSGHTRSCGCLQREIVRMKGLRHGHARRKKASKTYWIWHGIIQRCTYAKSAAYKYYGGRGIKVCDRWLVFDNFLADMGEKPPGKTIDRINNDGHYEPDNCRWATMKEQSQNKNNNNQYTKGRKSLS